MLEFLSVPSLEFKQHNAFSSTLNSGPILVMPLHNAQLGGSNVQCIHIRCQFGISLLGSVGADEGVDLDGFNVIHLRERSFDLWLGCPVVILGPTFETATTRVLT